MPSFESLAYSIDVKENYDKTGWWFQIEKHGKVVYVSDPWTQLSTDEASARNLADMIVDDLIIKSRP